jgi:NDP-sugar pyrophosphorylase family protein
MIAVILAAGRGTRMGSLTENLPKPMLVVHGKNLIEWKLEALPNDVTKVIFVVGYMKEKIIDYFGSSWNGIALQYVTQETLDGTGGALLLCKNLLAHEERFLVLMGDDIYDAQDLEELCLNTFSILVADKGDAGRQKGWQVFFDEHNHLEKINQNVEEVTSPYINTGAYCLGQDYFSSELYKMSNGEYSLPHTLLTTITKSTKKDSTLTVRVVVARKWIQITDKETLDEAAQLLK